MSSIEERMELLRAMNALRQERIMELEDQVTRQDRVINDLIAEVEALVQRNKMLGIGTYDRRAEYQEAEFSVLGGKGVGAEDGGRG